MPRRRSLCARSTAADAKNRAFERDPIDVSASFGLSAFKNSPAAVLGRHNRVARDSGPCALAVAMASPTPHRMALCALARYLGTSRPFDAEASELRVREPPPSCVRNLSESDWRLLSLVLMEEATASEGRREPSMRAFHASLDRFSRARGAPPAEPLPPPPHVEAATEVRVARSPDETRAASGIPDERRSGSAPEPPREAFLAKRLAECHALLRDAPPANFADVLVEAVGSLRDVDDLERLFREVEPRSAHAAEMRDERDGDARWASPVDADSAVGVFLRQCIADFAAAPFERACALAQAMDAYRREGHGEYDASRDDGSRRDDVVANETIQRETILRADARWDALEAAAERADAAAERRRAVFSSEDARDHLYAATDGRTDTTGGESSGALEKAFTAAQFRECYSRLAVSRDGEGEGSFAFPPPADPLALLERASRPTRAAEAARVRDAMLRADAGESARLGDDETRAFSSFAEDTPDAFFAGSGDAHLLAHLDAARRREFETAEAHLRRHFDYVDPEGLDGVQTVTTRAVSGSSVFATGFAPPADALRDDEAAGAAAADGQALSRRRLHAAALALARAHARAGRADEALKALNETVRVAQQNGDAGALANAVAALCALSAASAAPVASREGVPAGVSSGDDHSARVEDHRVLLQRLAAQARALKDPALLAFADIASARRRAARPAASARSAPETGYPYGGVAAAAKGAAPSGSSAFATAAARARAVRASPPATATAASRRVEELRHHAALGAAAPVSPLAAPNGDASESRETRANQSSRRAFYPPPRGLSAEALADAAVSFSVSQLAGSGSALAAAVYESHGLAESARLCALKHLRLDASKCALGRPAPRGAGAEAREDAENADPSPETLSSPERLRVTSVAAAAADTATALAQLARHASREHGPEAAAGVLEVASRRFPGFRARRSSDGGLAPRETRETRETAKASEKEDERATREKGVGSVGVEHGPAPSPAAAAAAAAAACETRLAACLARESYHDARACVSTLAALSPALSCWDPETRVETRRAAAKAKLCARDLVGAHDDAVRCAAAARTLETGATHKSVAASLDLAEVFLRAGAHAQALPHALAAEHIAAVAKLDGARAAATAAAAECLLGLDAGGGGAFARAAAEALDAHAVGLLGKGGLAVRARARLAAGKAALAMRERRRFAARARGGEGDADVADVADVETDEAAAPLASAAAAAEAAGSFALEAEAHYLRAMRLNQLGDTKGRNEAARAFRRCERAARRARRGDPGATGEATR